MENEYNLLEERLTEGDISNREKLKILERQKELLLLFLIDANRNLFNTLKDNWKKVELCPTPSFLESHKTI